MVLKYTENLSILTKDCHLTRVLIDVYMTSGVYMTPLVM